MKIKYIAILLILLCFLIGAASAADNGTVDSLDAAQDDAVSIDAVEEADEVASTEPTSTQTDEKLEQSNDELKSTNENETIATTTDDGILKEQNNQEPLKSGTNNVNVNSWSIFQQAITNAVNDGENETYIINLTSGIRIPSNMVFEAGDYTPHIIINGNNQELTVASSFSYISFKNKCNITIINLKISSQIQNYEDNNLILKNSTINAKIINEGNLTICDDVKFGNNAMIDSLGNIITNDTTGILFYLSGLNGNYILENMTITSEKTNYGNLTIRNSTINAMITNKGNLTICDDVKFGVNCYINNDGKIIINDLSRILPYYIKFNGTYILENVTVNKQKTNYGNLTFKNVTLTALFTNNGNLTIENSTLNQQIRNNGILTIADDVTFDTKFSIAGDGQVIVNDINKLLPYFSTYNGDYVLENITVGAKTNNGNLTIINSSITGTITNNGNMTIVNSTIKGVTNKGTLMIKNMTLNSKIQNTGVLIIDDDVTIGTSFQITGTGGRVLINDYNKVFKYMNDFRDEGSVELGNYNKIIKNYGNLTITNTIFNEQVLNNNPGKITIINSITNTNKAFTNSGIMEFINSTINTTITNTGILIISEDSILGENFKIAAGYAGAEGQVLTNNTQLIDYVSVYKGDIVLNNKTITTSKTNKGTLTLNNCTINSTISNDGIIIIDEDTVFGENARITGAGEIRISDISKILPIIDTINGNYEIKDTELTKNYAFNGEVTLINCTITNSDNTNFGTLKLNNCTVNVGEENTFLINYGTVIISKDTKIIGKIVDLVDGVIYDGAPKTYIVTQDTIGYFFDEVGLTSIVNPGDTLNIQGTIKLNRTLTINKPVNIISTTKDAYIDLNTTAGNLFGENPGNRFAINKDGSYTNITGIYFHNTQLWITNTHHITLNGISAVVEDQRVGSGVGQTSIRDNSSYITVKNSHFYTRNNGGSSTLVLAWANYCTIENNTIVGVGSAGNLLYLTTYNVNIPQGSMFNSHNKLINNRITGPESAAICYGICLTGYDNLVDNNTITYSGAGITSQWGSGVTGIEQAESLVGSGENTVSNNKLYGGCGISAGDLIYNNYMEGTLSAPKNSKAYNNTAKGLELAGNSSEVYNNTIEGKATFADSVTNVIVENNNIAGNIIIPATATNNVISNNNITGSVTLDGSFNNLTNNRIITSDDYAVSSNKLGQNNNLTGNYLVANGKVGNDAVSLRDPSNVIASAGVATKVEVSVPGEVTVNKTVQVTIKLTDANGNPIDGQVTVSSALGSETVNVTKGTGVYQYTPKAIGEDTISVKFAGNDTFYLSSNSANVKVVAEQQKTPVKPAAKTVVSLSFVKAPKKVSKKAKKLIISAKLKVNGKLVAGKKLTFKFKGKTFKVKTNKKGVAKLTIKSKVLKKLLKKVKAGKKVKYQVSYGKKTVKKTLKVKK